MSSSADESQRPAAAASNVSKQSRMRRDAELDVGRGRIMVTKNIIEDDQPAAARKMSAKLRPLLSTIDENVEIQHESPASDGKRLKLDEKQLQPNDSVTVSSTSVKTPTQNAAKASDDSFDVLGRYVSDWTDDEAATSRDVESPRKENGSRDSCKKTVKEEPLQDEYVPTSNTSSGELETFGKKSDDGDGREVGSESEQMMTLTVVDKQDPDARKTLSPSQTDAQGDDGRPAAGDRVHDNRCNAVTSSSELTGNKDETPQIPTGSSSDHSASTLLVIDADDDGKSVAKVDGESRSSQPAENETESAENGSGISQPPAGLSAVVGGQSEEKASAEENLDKDGDSSAAELKINEEPGNTETSTRSADDDVVACSGADDGKPAHRHPQLRQFIVPVKRDSTANN